MIFFELHLMCPLTRKERLVMELCILKDLVGYLWRNNFVMEQLVIKSLG